MDWFILVPVSLHALAALLCLHGFSGRQRSGRLLAAALFVCVGCLIAIRSPAHGEAPDGRLLPALLATMSGVLSVVLAVRLGRILTLFGHAERKASVLNDEMKQYADEAATHLEASQARFRQLTDLTPIGVMEASADGAFQFVSRRWCEMVGLEREQARGDGWLACVADEDRQRVEQEWRDAVQDQRRIVTEFRVRNAPGQPTWMAWQTTPRLMQSGEVTGHLGTLTDVTDRKVIEQRRHELEEQERRQHNLESLAILVGGLAQDFSELLADIRGRSDQLKALMPPGSDPLRQIEAIDSSAVRAADLAGQMLACSGYETRRPERVDLSVLVEETLQLLENSRPDHVAVERSIESGLPEVSVDPSQARRLVFNLVHNAFNAAPAQAARVRVRTGEQDLSASDLQAMRSGARPEPGRYVFIEVSDNGLGMDQDALGKAFDPRHGTRSSSRGLGLAVVQGVVRSHRSALRIVSTPGRGTIVQAFFSAVSAASVDSSRALSSDPEQEDATHAGSGTILVVDDEKAVLETVEAMLRSAGFEVAAAGSGREAIELFRERADRIDTVLLDMSMPDLDGEATFRELRQIRPDARVILYSGYTEQNVFSRFSERGVAGFLHKPFRKQELIAKLNEVQQNRI